VIKSGIGQTGRVGAFFTSAALAAAFIAAGCGDNGVAPPDAAVDAPPPPAVLTITPLTQPFGSQAQGTTSGAKTFTITNTGGSESGAITPVITGTNSADFAATNGCTTLIPAGTCIISVTFTPSSPGGKTANLVVSASPGGSVMATMDGSGTAVGDLTLSPGSHSFTPTVVGTTSALPDKTFTITNPSGTASGPLTVTATGDSSEFTKVSDNCNGMAVAAAGTCTIVVRFAPLSAGPKVAGYTIVGNPGGTLTAAVTGTALAPARIVVSPGAQPFGSIALGGMSSEISFTVANTGGVPTTAVSQAIVPATDFVITGGNCTGAILQPVSGGGATCTVLVRFQPTGAAGAKAATLNVTATTGGTGSSNLSGTATTPGALSATTPIAFGPITVGTTAGAQTITVTNSGGTSVGPLVTALTGSAEFSIVTGGNGCQGTTLTATGTPGATCTISVTFAPTSAGAGKTANLAITAPSASTSSTLTGDGIPAAALSISPLSKDFGSLTTGTTGQQSFRITNTGGQTTSALAVVTTGSAEFSVNPGTCAALAPLAFCDVIVTYAPLTTGAKAGSLDVTGTGLSVSAPLAGNGLSPASITPNPTNLTFAGNTLVGTSTSPLSFTVTNNGTSTTGNIVVAVSGTNAGDFTTTDNCTTLLANASCTVDVVFSPSAPGARTASVDVSATPGGSFGVGVSGTGQARLEILNPNVNPFDFGTLNISGGFSQCESVTIRNNTASQVTVVETLSASLIAGLDYNVCTPPVMGAGSECAGILNAGATCTMGVRFSPDTVGTTTASVTWSIGAGAQNTTQQDFTGVGTSNQLTISPCTGGNCTASPTPSFNYGNVNVGSIVTQVFTLTNQTMATTGVLETNLGGSFTTFHILQDNCAGTTLAVNASCTVTVSFQPEVAAPLATNQLVIRDITTLPASQAARDLEGVGQDPAALVGAPTTVAPFNFTPVTPVFIGETSAAAGQPFVISNSGDVNSGPITVAVTGDAAFAIQTGAAGDCVSGTTIIGPVAGVPTPAVVTSCNVRVRFQPTVVHAGTANHQATLTVTGTPGGTTGQANNLIAQSRSTISVAAVGTTDFGNVILGQTLDLPFTMTNNSTTQTVSFQSGMLPNGEFTVVDVVGCATLAPLATCNFDIRFAPTGMVGVQRGPIALTMNATNGIATLAGILGVGQSVANLVITPTTGDFGSVLSGTGASALNFQLTNNGFQTATGIVISIPTAAGNYTQINTCGGSLLLGQSCTITVTFAPPLANTGVLNATLAVASTLGGAPTATLTGRGIANGQVTVSPATKDFGSAVAGQQSAQQIFTLLNTSAAMVANLSLTPPTDFVIDNTGVAAPLCTATLNPVNACNIGVRFAPGSAGVKTAQFAFTAGTYVALQGVGLSNANMTGLAAHDFGIVRIGGVSAGRSYTITNTNLGFTGTMSSVLTGPNAIQFLETFDNCTGTNLAPGASCQVIVQFQPQAPLGFGPMAATLTVTSDADPLSAGEIPVNGGIAISAALTGTGANQQDITIAPTTTQDDGSRPVGQLDTVATVFTITNAVGSASTGALSWPALSDPANFVFTTTGLVNACVNGSTTLAGGASCQLGILFHPSSTGIKTANLTVTEAGVGDSVALTVTGTGTEQLRGPTMATALTANMNSTLTLTNNANVATTPLVCDETNLGNQVSMITNNCVAQVIPAGGSCTVVVRYVPDGLNGPTGALFACRSQVNLTSPPYGVSGLTAPSEACFPSPTPTPGNVYCTFTP